jgi:hypothetical protein
VITVPDGPPLADDYTLRTDLLGNDGKPIRIPDLDLSSFGVRMAVGIGF